MEKKFKRQKQQIIKMAPIKTGFHTQYNVERAFLFQIKYLPRHLHSHVKLNKQ